jgi:hypothetical protein
MFNLVNSAAGTCWRMGHYGGASGRIAGVARCRWDGRSVGIVADPPTFGFDGPQAAMARVALRGQEQSIKAAT